MAFGIMQGSLYDVIRQRRGLTLAESQKVCTQVMSALKSIGGDEKFAPNIFVFELMPRSLGDLLRCPRWSAATVWFRIGTWPQSEIETQLF